MNRKCDLNKLKYDWELLVPNTLVLDLIKLYEVDVERLDHCPEVCLTTWSPDRRWNLKFYPPFYLVLTSPLLFFPLGHSIFRDGIHQAPSLLSLLFCLPHCPFCFPVCSFPCHFSCSYCFPFSSFQSLFLASLTPASFKFFFTLLMYN